MYSAKAKGKNQIAMFHPVMTGIVNAELASH
jgi:hypothetical protein